MILYPNLLQPFVLEVPNPFATDFWRNVLERLAVGETPFGTSVMDNHLTFKKHSLDLCECSARDVIDFFTDTVGLSLEFVHFASWKEIKRKVIKDNLIQDYVMRSQQHYQLTTTDAQRLLSMIHLYLTIKRILPSEIHLETYPQMYIQAIDGISFKPGRFAYTLLGDRSSIVSDSDDSEFESLISDTELIEELDEDDSIE